MSMSINLINPQNDLLLKDAGRHLVDEKGQKFSKRKGVFRICEQENYTENFGVQWNKFSETQLDRLSNGLVESAGRLFSSTQWERNDLSGVNVLEVGSGAGRFSRVLLMETEANLYSIDFSDAVTANFNNNGSIAPERFFLFQASIYEMPFEDNSFDKVFCFGVLQHTPDFKESVRALISKAKPGGEIVVDFYPIKGWWTKICAKYLLRPFTRRIEPSTLLELIEKNIDWLISAHLLLHKIHLGILARFLPVCNITGSFPEELSDEERRELAILDTFDQYSPQYDNPQKIAEVIDMFEKNGATVRFAEEVVWGDKFKASVVRAIKDE